MNSTAILLVAGGLFGAAGVALSGSHLSALAATGFTPGTYRALSLFSDVFDRVRSDYVEQPDESALIKGAINGMLSGLDPQSRYIDPQDFKAMQAKTAGKFGGVGLDVTMENDAIKVISPLDDTPASRAGLLAGDMIVDIDGESVDNMTLGQVSDELSGPTGSTITLTVVRQGKDKPFDVTLVREETVVQSVKSREEGRVGYIRIAEFSDQTAVALKAAIDKIQSDIGGDKVLGYVVDLRNDPGGLLDQAVTVSDDFLNDGEIVSLRGRTPDEVQSFKATRGDLTVGKPIIVLINGGSASASEVVAGALQDHRRATVIGTKSFGEGSVQTTLPLGTDGALRLTTARYYTPSGRSIQAAGIVPDITVTEDSPTAAAAATQPATGDANHGGGLSGTGGGSKQASGSPADVPDLKGDRQLNFALDLLRGVQVNAAFPPDPGKGVPN